MAYTVNLFCTSNDVYADMEVLSTSEDPECETTTIRLRGDIPLNQVYVASSQGGYDSWLCALRRHNRELICFDFRVLDDTDTKHGVITFTKLNSAIGGIARLYYEDFHATRLELDVDIDTEVLSPLPKIDPAWRPNRRRQYPRPTSMSSFRLFTDAFGITSTSAAAAAAPAVERSPVIAWPTKPAGAKPGEPEAPASLIAMLVDRSGSMSSMGTEVAGGCNGFLDEQRKGDAITGIPSHLIFSIFDDYYDTVRNAPLADQPAVTSAEIAPRGMTALYDAIGKCLDNATAAANARVVPFEKVCVFILTDGEENSSKRYKKKDITLRIQRLETEFGWEFYFAAANQDAMKTGTALGVKGEQCVTFDAATPGAAEACFRTTSSKVNAVRSGNYESAGYTQEERESCMTGDQ